MFKKGQIIVKTSYFQNGNSRRIVGIVNSVKDIGNDTFYCGLFPVPEPLAGKIRETYLTENFNHQGLKNCYSDQYTFAYNRLNSENTEIIGEY
jgi:hypothetical protein